MGTEAHGHRYFEGLAVAHVLGGLDETDGRVFRSHLLECSDCRARVGELRAIAHELADVERDERRVRAAKTIETKRRESAEEEDEEPPAPVASSPRLPRLLVVAGMIALIGLALWNYSLRDSLTTQEAIVDNVTDAAELLHFGDEVTDVEINASEEVEARILTDQEGGQAALLVTGLPDDTRHDVYQVDDTMRVLDTYPMRTRDHRLFVLVTLRPETRQLWVNRPRLEDGESAESVRVITATLP